MLGTIGQLENNGF